MTRGRARLHVLSLCGAVVLVASATACEDSKKPPVARGGSMADTAEQVMYNVRSIITHSGVQRGELLADTAFVFNDQTKFVFRNVRVNFTKDNGAPNGTMRADRGFYDLRTQVLEGFGNVSIKTLDGRSLAAPQLRYVQSTNTVSSDSSFKMSDGSRRQEGVGFTSDPNLTHFTCMKRCGGSAPIALPSQ